MQRREALARITVLVGGTLSASTLAGLVSGCQSGSAPGFVPATLDPDLFRLTAELTDLIIPPTDTPGAREAGVPEFIDRLLTGWASESEKTTFVDGLKYVLRASGSSHDPAALTDILTELESESGSDPPDFFRLLKEWTLAGYYTSEVGATEELRFLIAPGRYEGCIPFSDVGRTWA